MEINENQHWSSWRAYYEKNAKKPHPEPQVPPSLSEEQKRNLARSLAIFQLGEAGEGRIVKEVDKFEHPAIDDDWRRALKFWVREEGRHGRILGFGVKSLGGAEIKENWTNELLIVGRRLLGIRLKLLVILTAEVIGIVFYGYMARAMQDGNLKEALELVVEEEKAHLSFHTRFFATQTPNGLLRAAFYLAWFSVGSAAGLTVLMDHYKTLNLLKVSKVSLVKDFVKYLGSVAGRVGKLSKKLVWGREISPKKANYLLVK